jgi:medium-chain acyl-[acyl-carrier-protein] hydrolase
MRLVCLPPAGANASAFDAWNTGLPAWIEVCAVQLPGRQERSHEPPPRRMSQLLPELEAAVAAEVPCPFVVFGSSLGAIVAFELVRRLERHGHATPARLVVSSAQAPHVAGRLPAYSSMPDAQFAAELASLEALPGETAEHPDLLEAVLPVLRADFELGQTYRYRPGPPVRVPIDAVTGSGDAHVPDSMVRPWGDLTTGGFASTRVQGAHDLLTQGSEGLHAVVIAACASARDSYTRNVAT